MTLQVFPTLPGIAWPAKRSPSWKNVIQEGLSGRRTAIRHQTEPRWAYELAVEFLRTSAGRTEFADLLGLYLKCNGSFGTFLFDDLNDNTVTAQPIGVGDGINQQFFLLRTFAGFDQRIAGAGLNGAASLYVNGALYAPTNYSIDPLGVVTFTAPPPNGYAVTWSGAYRWLCRFDDDQLDLSQFMSNFWEVKTLKFSTEIIVG